MKEIQGIKPNSKGIQLGSNNVQVNNFGGEDCQTYEERKE